MKNSQVQKKTTRHKEEKNEVAKLLSPVQKNAVDPELVNELPLRMSEMNSFIHVIHVSLETDLYDETFYRKHVGQMMYLFEKRFNELQVLVGELVNREWDSRKETAKIVT